MTSCGDSKVFFFFFNRTQKPIVLSLVIQFVKYNNDRTWKRRDRGIRFRVRAKTYKISPKFPSVTAPWNLFNYRTSITSYFAESIHAATAVRARILANNLSSRGVTFAQKTFSGFRAYPRECLRGLVERENNFVVSETCLMWLERPPTLDKQTTERELVCSPRRTIEKLRSGHEECLKDRVR